MPEGGWRTGVIGAGGSVVALVWVAVVFAQSGPTPILASGRPPDMIHGAQVAQGCLSCHGSDIAFGDPPYHIPRLYGQNAAYLARALHDYADGRRDDVVMHDQATALTQTDIADVSAYFNGARPKPPPPNSSGDIPVQVVESCSACHGETGLATLPEVAVLSGQYGDYLDHALSAYASGERRNPVMSPIAGKLTPADRAAVSAYFARLGMLKTSR